jgi:hypothetical protein
LQILEVIFLPSVLNTFESRNSLMKKHESHATIVAFGLIAVLGLVFAAVQGPPQETLGGAATAAGLRCLTVDYQYSQNVVIDAYCCQNSKGEFFANTRARSTGEYTQFTGSDAAYVCANWDTAVYCADRWWC